MAQLVEVDAVAQALHEMQCNFHAKRKSLQKLFVVEVDENAEGESKFELKKQVLVLERAVQDKEAQNQILKDRIREFEQMGEENRTTVARIQQECDRWQERRERLALTLEVVGALSAEERRKVEVFRMQVEENTARLISWGIEGKRKCEEELKVMGKKYADCHRKLGEVTHNLEAINLDRQKEEGGLNRENADLKKLTEQQEGVIKQQKQTLEEQEAKISLLFAESNERFALWKTFEELSEKLKLNLDEVQTTLDDVRHTAAEEIRQKDEAYSELRSYCENFVERTSLLQEDVEAQIRERLDARARFQVEIEEMDAEIEPLQDALNEARTEIDRITEDYVFLQEEAESTITSLREDKAKLYVNLGDLKSPEVPGAPLPPIKFLDDTSTLCKSCRQGIMMTDAQVFISTCSTMTSQTSLSRPQTQGARRSRPVWH